MIKFEIQFKDKANDNVIVTLKEAKETKTTTKSEKIMCAMVKAQIGDLLKNMNK